MLLFLIECKINTLTLKPKDVLKFNPIPLQLLSPQLAFIRIVKKFAWPLQPFATNRGIHVVLCHSQRSGRVNKLDVAPPCGSHNTGMAYLPAAFAGGKEDHIALLQVMDRYLFAYFTLLSRSPGQVDACTLERKIDQGGAIHPRARSAPITVGRTSKGFGRFHYLVDPLTPDFSGG